MSRRQISVFAFLVIGIFIPRQTRAQTGLVDPRKTEYICVLARTQNFTVSQNVPNIGVIKADGTVLVLPCEAANIRQDRLVDADYTALEKMQVQRILFEVLRTRPNSDAEVRSTRVGFHGLAKEVCQRHPKIALLPLDWKVEQTRMSDRTEAGGLILKTCSSLMN